MVQKYTCEAFILSFLHWYYWSAYGPISIWSSWCHCHSSSLASLKSFQGHSRSGQGHVRFKVSKMTIFKIYLLRHFSTDQKNSDGFW